MPGRLLERLGEAVALSDLPAPLRREAGMPAEAAAQADTAELSSLLALFGGTDATSRWTELPPLVEAAQTHIESRLPNLLSPAERARRERLLLKLVILIPQEYAAGVRDGQITVPLEYHE